MAYTHDLIVIGGGAAGLTASGIGANLGAKTLLIERHRLGGDCTWTGCVPSKALLRAAKAAHAVTSASRYGVEARLEKVDFARVIERVHRLREEIYEDADRPEIYEAMGVDTCTGDARFVDAHTVEVDTEDGPHRFDARCFVIATGARAAVPPIDGLDDVPYLTNETLFEVTEQPRRLAIIGAGPIGTEMAQAFQRLGTHVTVLDVAGRILQNDDEELAGLLRGVLEEEGVQYVLDASIERVSQDEGGTIRIEATAGGERRTVEAEALLVATGQRPNVEGLGLEAAGVAFERDGITVDDHCRTGVRHVYAAGDVTGRYQFTHMSDHMAKVAVTNALTKWPMKIDAGHVPWVTFTDPELAHVGATEAQLQEAGTKHTVFRFPFARIDRAITDGDTIGHIKVFARKRSGKILGASILGAGAGDLIGEYALAMRHGVTLRQIADTIHPYPTHGLGLRRAADQWYIQNHSPLFVRLLQTVMRYRGQVNTYDENEIV